MVDAFPVHALRLHSEVAMGRLLLAEVMYKLALEIKENPGERIELPFDGGKL